MLRVVSMPSGGGISRSISTHVGAASLGHGGQRRLAAAADRDDLDALEGADELSEAGAHDARGRRRRVDADHARHLASPAGGAASAGRRPTAALPGRVPPPRWAARSSTSGEPEVTLARGAARAWRRRSPRPSSSTRRRARPSATLTVTPTRVAPAWAATLRRASPAAAVEELLGRPGRARVVGHVDVHRDPPRAQRAGEVGDRCCQAGVVQAPGVDVDDRGAQARGCPRAPRRRRPRAPAPWPGRCPAGARSAAADEREGEPREVLHRAVVEVGRHAAALDRRRLEGRLQQAPRARAVRRAAGGRVDHASGSWMSHSSSSEPIDHRGDRHQDAPAAGVDRALALVELEQGRRRRRGRGSAGTPPAASPRRARRRSRASERSLSSASVVALLQGLALVVAQGIPAADEPRLVRVDDASRPASRS